MNLIELFSFIKNDNWYKVKDVILKNPKILNEMYYGATPLIYSIECKNEKIALELCQYPNIDLGCKSNEDESVLMKAIEYKMFKIIEFYCSKCKKASLNQLFDSGETLLTDTLKRDEKDSSIALINGGVDINMPNSLNELPIQLVIRFNKIEVLNAMLKNPDIYLRTFENGYSPLVDACERDLTEISILLIENGADINFQDKNQGWSPLMWAISNNNEIIVQKILEKDCNLNLVDADGNTCLHLATESENDVLVKYLLGKNANKNVVNNENRTPISIAKENDDEYCIKLLS